MLEVDRRQVLAYRIAAHGLHRDRTDPAALSVSALGVQDSMRDTALLALSARLSGEFTGQSLVDDDRLALAWTLRGAPHYHRAGDLRGLMSALLPVSDADGLARMAWQRKDIELAGMPVQDAITVTAGAIREVVREPMTKGAVSTAISAMLPEGLLRWCRGCQATHVHEQLMRLASLPAGVRLVPGAFPATLAPLPRVRTVAETADVAGARRIVRSYLTLHGPASKADAAGFLGSTAGIVGDRLWPDELAEVLVDGKRAFLPAERLDELAKPPEPDVVRLLPPADPLLQGRDRAVLVPDRAYQKEIWRILGNPGALLADGEIAGTWRAKTSGKRLDLTVSPLWTLPEHVRVSVETDAARVARARGLGDVRVRW